ncbi:hypothetical protein CSUI_001014 [Cystoisospora suis]|uniref:Uncharacterized protein n=1 Tax=Cystoisospora suis TaxID=483139 RepID=A0A2C6LEE9_9APIC|nr:hypothetical protein CSUI_001014 [Cystoisospora suis]
MSLSSDDDDSAVGGGGHCHGGGGMVGNGFYDTQSVSEGGTVDSFVIRNIHLKRDRARRGEDPDEDEGGFFSTFVSTFKHCCAPSSRKHMNGRADGMGGDGTGMGLGIGAGRLSATGGGVSNSKALLLYGGVRKGGGKRTPTYGSSSSSTSSSSASTGRLGGGRNAMNENGGGGEENEALRRLISWRITDTSGASRTVVLTTEQAGWACLVWSVRLENSERMSGRMLGEILLGAEQQKRDVDLSNALKTTPQLQAIDLLRRLEGRVMEDIVGDFSGAIMETQKKLRDIGYDEDDNSATGGAVYMVISKIRVLGLYARKQGEFLDVAIFDPLPSEEDPFPPSFLGFKRVEDLQEFVLGTFKNDPREKRSPQAKITAFLFRSKHLYGPSAQQKDFTAPRPVGKDGKKIGYFLLQSFHSSSPCITARIQVSLERIVV